MYVTDCEGLRDDSRADIIQLWERENKNTSWESKSIHCAMKPFRIQLESPYNSSNETKIPMYEFLYSLHKHVLFCTSHVREPASTNLISFIQQSIATQCFIPLINQFCFLLDCHIYLSMTDINQPRCQHKNTFNKIMFNYQYWLKFLYLRPQNEKKV